MTRVIELAPGDVHDLRRRVLRAGDPAALVEWPGDHDDSTVHLGIVIDGDVVAVSTWLERPCPDRPDESAVQLRGMATDPARRGTGLGALLLEAGVERWRSTDVLWANARLTAIGFYERAGWVPTGDVFTTAEVGLPHRLITFGAGPHRD